VRAVVFAYHEIGYVCLEEVIAAGVQVPCLFTHRDDPGEEVWFRTPRVIAEKHAIPIYEPESLRDPSWVDFLKGLSPDFLFSFYYRNMLPEQILQIPKVAPLNLHGSLLPRFRGRAPVNWVLIEGEERTGLTLHVMEVKPDAGDIIARIEVPITFEDTAQSLFMKMATAARRLMKEVLPRLIDGTFQREPQSGPSSYYGGRKPEDGLIDWTKPARAVYNLIRAVTHPYPGAFTLFQGKKLFLWKALPEQEGTDAPPGAVTSTSPLLIATGQGLLRPLSVQLEGEEEMEGERFSSLHKLDHTILGGGA
jgi:methionyl-tRNA formyltransferase